MRCIREWYPKNVISEFRMDYWGAGKFNDDFFVNTHSNKYDYSIYFLEVQYCTGTVANSLLYRYRTVVDQSRLLSVSSVLYGRSEIVQEK